MKNFYAFMLAVLVAAVSFAQGAKAPHVRKAPVSLGVQKTLAVKHVKHAPIKKAKGVAKAAAATDYKVVVLPEGLQTESYAMEATGAVAGEGKWVAESISQTVEVAFNGADVYISGLSYWVPNAFVKGTLTDGQVIIPPTYMGLDDDNYENYLLPYTENESGDDYILTNLVLDFDAETRVLTLNENYFYAESDDPTGEEGWYDYWLDLTLTPGEAAETETVEVPEGLTEEMYVIKAQGYDYDEEDNEVEVPVLVVGKVAFDDTNKEVYIQGLCSYLPEAWVKGTVSGNVVTLPTGQYFGLYESLFGDYDMYFVGTDDEWETESDVKFTLSADRKTLTTTNWVITAGSRNLDDAYDYWSNVSIIKPEDKAATPAAPEVTDFEDWNEMYGYGYVYVSIPLVDTNDEVLLPEKLSYKFFVDEAGKVSEYKFAADLYDELEADMVEVPYLFDDDYDFDHDGGEIFVAFNSETASYDRIGVQSIYRGGNAENKSEISWLTIERGGGEYDAVKGITADSQGKTAIYNLAGQRVQKPTKGLYILNGKKMLVK